MMKLRRRRPLSVYNPSPNTSINGDQTNHKRQRKVSRQTSSNDDDDERERSIIQTRSITAAATNKSIEYLEVTTSEDDDDEQSMIQQPKTRMVTRQMSLVINNKNTKVKIQPFVDHTEDSLSSEQNENSKTMRLRPRRGNNGERSDDNGAQFFLRTAPIDDDDTSQPAAFSSIKKESLFYDKTPQRPDEDQIDYEQLVNRTRIKPASMDQCNQGQLLPDENHSHSIELIPYLLQLEQSLMPILPVIKGKKTASVIYPRRVQCLLDYLYGPQRCGQISELIHLHLRSRLVLNTLFLTVNLFDRAILTGQIPRETYSDNNPHLLLTCLLIAGKFEEVEWPSISSLIANRENLTANEIKSLEIIVLQSLSFDIGLTVLDFVYRYCEISPMDQSNDDLRLLFFILQLLLIDPHTFIAHKSSYIAACSYALVRHLKQYEVTWPRRLARLTGYDPTEIAYGVSKVAAQCLRALPSNVDQHAAHRDLTNKYNKGPANQLIKYEQTLQDLIEPVDDD